MAYEIKPQGLFVPWASYQPKPTMLSMSWSTDEALGATCPLRHLEVYVMHPTLYGTSSSVSLLDPRALEYLTV
jgi:hypothetical protein